MNWVVSVLVGAVALLAVAIWSIKRHKDPHLQLAARESIDELIPSISGVSLGMAFRGNAVEIFQNGAFFDALLEDISAARRTVHFEPSCGRRASSDGAWPMHSRSRRAPG
jgi:cardiolipin synthase